MGVFYGVLVTLAVSAPVFAGGGAYLGYKYGRKVQERFAQAVIAAGEVAATVKSVAK